MPRVLTVLLALALAPAALAPADALAQGSMSEAFKGFGANRKDPIQIEADSLEVRDKESVALFSGNVLVRQSQTVMKARGSRSSTIPSPARRAAPACRRTSSSAGSKPRGA